MPIPDQSQQRKGGEAVSIATATAVIGAGYWGKNLVRNLHQLGALRAVCDSDPSTLAAAARNHPGITVTASLDEVLADAAVGSVAVASPAATHHDVVKRALSAGKDVFVEKPLALTVREGEELVALARRNGRILMVGHLLQYHPAVLKLKEMVAAGDLGRIQYIYSNRLNIGKLRTEENILWSFAPHDISVLLFLLGEEPRAVSCTGGAYLNRDVFDTTLTALEFRDGVRGHIFVSWLHPFKEQKLVVIGSKAMAVFDDVSTEKLFLYPHSIEWRDGKVPLAHKAAHAVIAFDAGEPLKLELSHFLECVATRRQPRTDGEEGLRVLRILEAAEKSLRGVAAATPPTTPGVFVHESSCVDPGVQIGDGSSIWHFSHVLRGSRLGLNCKVGQNVVIGPNVVIGDNVKIQNNVSVYEGVTLEDHVFCGPSTVFTNVFNPRSEIPRMNELRPTLVRRGATLGANSTIVCGHTIGCYAFVGAGAVVTKDVPDYALVAGNPARQRGWVCRCGARLDAVKAHVVCAACGNRYRHLRKAGTLTAVEERST